MRMCSIASGSSGNCIYVGSRYRKQLDRDLKNPEKIIG